VPYTVVGCCEMDIHSYRLLCRKGILDVLFQQGELVYGLSPLSKARLLQYEQWVDDCIDTSVDESLEDFKEDQKQRRYRTVDP